MCRYKVGCRHMTQYANRICCCIRRVGGFSPHRSGLFSATSSSVRRYNRSEHLSPCLYYTLQYIYIYIGAYRYYNMFPLYHLYIYIYRFAGPYSFAAVASGTVDDVYLRKHSSA